MTSNLILNIDICEPKWETSSEDLDNYSERVVNASIDYVKQVKYIDFLSLGKPIIVGLSLNNDKNVQELNKGFRNKDKATNVLSFANIDSDGFYDDIKLFDEIELGDIIISFETLEQEAKEKEISFIHHYTHLLTHGILHLLGFDHIEDDEADYMEDFEAKILKTFNIDNPYTE